MFSKIYSGQVSRIAKVWLTSGVSRLRGEWHEMPSGDRAIRSGLQDVHIQDVFLLARDATYPEAVHVVATLTWSRNHDVGRTRIDESVLRLACIESAQTLLSPPVSP